MDIKELISENEKIIWEVKPNKMLYIWSTILTQLPFAFVWLILNALIFSSFSTTEITTTTQAYTIVFLSINLVLVLIVAGVLIKNRLEYKNVIYAITDKRVIIKDGLIGIDFESVDYEEIDKISVNVSILEKLYKVGTIKLKVDDFTYQLLSIEKPYEIFKRLQKISFDVKTDIDYPNAKRPENNPGYNSKHDKI